MREKADKLVAKGLVADEAGDLLIVRRTLDRVWNPGGWDFIGGTFDPAIDRSLSDTIDREGGEEANHDGEGFQIAWKGLVYWFRDIDEVPRHQIVDTGVFEGEVEGVQPEPSLTKDEHSEFLWLPVHELLLVDDLPEQYKDAALAQQERLASLLD